MYTFKDYVKDVARLDTLRTHMIELSKEVENWTALPPDARAIIQELNSICDRMTLFESSPPQPPR